MRLWHESLLPFLPREQLLGQHRECCALRGKGWGKKHATVDYVFTHDPARLVAYHFKVMQEMVNRRYQLDRVWIQPLYRGKKLGFDLEWVDLHELALCLCLDHPVFPEHNEAYMKECLDNLERKGIKMY